MNCQRCGKEQAIYSRPVQVDVIARQVTRELLGRSCFERYVIDAALTAWDRSGLDGRAKVVVGMSGGKDSQLVLTVMSRIREERAPDLSLVGVSVNEGILPYRDQGIELARRFCSRLGVRHEVISFACEFGATVDSIVGSVVDRGRACTFCVPPRLGLLVGYCRQNDGDVLAVGTNIDDLCSDFLLTLGSASEAAAVHTFTPVHQRFPGDVKWFKPLWRLTDQEIALYLLTAQIPYQTTECPYSDSMAADVMRDQLHRLEMSFPGYRYAVSSHAGKIRSLTSDYRPGRFKQCSDCQTLLPDSGPSACLCCRVLHQVNWHGRSPLLTTDAEIAGRRKVFTPAAEN